MLKKCIKCKVEKPLDDFYTNPINKDGLTKVCKHCTTRKTYHSEYSLKNFAIKNCELCGISLGYVSVKLKYCNICREIKNKESKLRYYNKKVKTDVHTLSDIDKVYKRFLTKKLALKRARSRVMKKILIKNSNQSSKVVVDKTVNVKLLSKQELNNMMSSRINAMLDSCWNKLK